MTTNTLIEYGTYLGFNEKYGYLYKKGDTIWTLNGGGLKKLTLEK